MKRKNFDHLNCPVAATLGVVGEHWNMLIIRDAFFGVRRFDEFHKRLGIARNVLSSRLKQLVDESILDKHRGDSGFPEYRLTEQGLALQPILLAMAQWGETYRPHDRGARLTFVDRHRREPIQALSARSSRGEVLGPRDVRVKLGPALGTGDSVANS